MADALIDLAEAIRADLAAGSFSLPISVTRAWNPSPELPEIAKPTDPVQVTIAPRGDAETIESRSHTRHELTIDVGVQQKLAARTNAAIDPLTQLTRELKRWLEHRTFASVNAKRIKTETATLCSPSHLDQLGQYTAVFTLTYLLVTSTGT